MLPFTSLAAFLHSSKAQGLKNPQTFPSAVGEENHLEALTTLCAINRVQLSLAWTHAFLITRICRLYPEWTALIKRSDRTRKRQIRRNRVYRKIMYDLASGQMYLINQLLNLKNTILPVNCYILAK